MTREEAIKRIQQDLKVNKKYLSEEYREALHMAIEALSADAVQGEWIDVNGDGSLWRCDQCKDTACCRGNYCPSCGARMENKE